MRSSFQALVTDNLSKRRYFWPSDVCLPTTDKIVDFVGQLFPQN